MGALSVRDMSRSGCRRLSQYLRIKSLSLVILTESAQPDEVKPPD
jgi:hypothetical protein